MSKRCIQNGKQNRSAPSLFTYSIRQVFSWEGLNYIYLRNTSALAVNCWVIIHCLVVSCKGDQITSPKLTNSELLLNNSLLELIFSDSKHARNDEKAVVSFWFFRLSAITLKKSRQRFDCNASVYMYLLHLLCAKTTLHCLTSRRHGWCEGWRHKTAPNSIKHFRPVNCCRIEHDFLPLAI